MLDEKNSLVGCRCISLLLGFCINCLSAETFELFTYTDNGNYITITDYPTSEIGTVVIPDTIIGKPVTSIGSYAFYSCTNLTSVTIPASVTSIGISAFQSCSSLTSITIPDSVTSIGSSAFQSCSSLTSITVSTQNLNYSSVDGILFNKNQSNLVQYPGGKEGTVVIPSTVTSIGSYAFYSCTNLTSVTIPASVTSIGISAFESCSSLTSITIPASVTSIGSSAFYSCSSLTSITFPASVTSIGSSAFYSCSSLTSITIPASVTSIGSSAFQSCSSLTSITIPASVTSIGSSAFQSCSSLTSITVSTQNLNYSSVDGILFNKNQSNLVQYPGGKEGTVVIPSTVTSIGDRAFQSCSSLTSITIPASITSIGSSAFQSCSSLTSITIPDSVTSIGSSAFQSCSSLTSITIPASVTSIGSSAFQSCSSLTSITVSTQNLNYSSVDGILFNKNQSNLVQYPGGKEGTVVIPSTVTSIGSYAFYSCSSLTSITIPASITSIGVWAFNRCSSLTSITIPASVTSIGSGAFSGCSALTSATFIGNAPSISDNSTKGRSFGSNAINFKVYFFSGKSGFTAPTWMGYPSVSMGDPSALSPWLISYGYAHDADLEADSDGDGVSLLLAYSLNLDPRQNLSDRMPRPVFTSNQMNLTFYAGSEGVSYNVESSADLQSWTTEGVSLSTPDINKFRTATVSTTDPCRFMRIVVAY
jgi:hypothetical protein